MPVAPTSRNVRLPSAETLSHLPRQAANPGTTRAVYARILTAANSILIPEGKAVAVWPIMSAAYQLRQ